MSITNVAISPEERIRRGLRVELDQEGGDPSRFLSMLADAMERRVWEPLGMKSFTQFVEAPWPDGLGVSTETVTTLIGLKHRHEADDPTTAERMQWMRRQVRDELHAELPKHGEVGNSRDYNIMSTPTKTQGTSESYTLRRLKRDAPELATRVLDGELSANAAAVEAGFRKRMISIPTEDAERAARSIRANMLPDTIRELVRLLGEP